MPPPNNEGSPSKLAGALEKKLPLQDETNKRLLAPSASRSTPFQTARRRKPSFVTGTMGPNPTRNPSMTYTRRRAHSGVGHSTTVPNSTNVDVRLLPRLEEENANLPPQDSIEFIMAQIERQNAMLDEDPKSVCIQSNELKAHLSTMQNLRHAHDDKEEEIDWEFWSALTDDFSAVAVKLPHLLSAKLRAGIPAKVRGVIWQAMSQSASLNLETVYGQLVAEHSPYERIIQRDLARTFPHVDMFKQEGGDGQKALERVLKAYSLYDAHVGYCQGLAFLVGPLLMNMPEQQTFCVFVRLMETYEMRTMFTLNMEGLQLRLYQFSSLLSQILPELSDHLATHAVHAPMYASQWFLTLFAYAFPIPLVLRIYDIVFAEGAAETIMRVAIAMLKHSQDQILQMSEFEDILDHVTAKLHRAYAEDPTRMITEAMELSGLITRDKMDHLADLYYREMEEEQKQTEQVMAVRFNFWSKQSTSTDKKKKRESASGWLGGKRSSTSQPPATHASQSGSSSDDEKAMRRHSSSSSSSSSTQLQLQQQQQDMANLHQQIEDLLLALSQTQKDQIQLKQELMQVRMDKMDVEAERDALKMTVMDMQEHQNIPEVSYRELKEQVEELQHQNKMAKEAQTSLVEELVNMKNRMEDLERDKLEANKTHQARIARAESMASELQLEKLSLLEQLDEHKQQQRRQVRRMQPQLRGASDSPSSATSSEEDTSLRCHELEQLLADAKLRIAELETFGQRSPLRRSTMDLPSPNKHDKRKSFDPVALSRVATVASTNNINKRSSFYGRLWSSVTSSQDTPPTSPT